MASHCTKGDCLMKTSMASKCVRFACALAITTAFGANFAASQATLRDCLIVIDPAKDPSTGTFRMLSQFSTVQIEDATGVNNGFPNSPHNYNTGFAVGDFDNDGDPDLYMPMAHRFDSMANLAKDRLFLNANGVLTDVTDSTPGAGLLGNGMGAVAVDYDNDDDMDIYVANYLEPNALLRNRLVEDGALSFEDVALASRVAVPVDGGAPIDNSSAAVFWADVDRDGDLDVYLVGLNNQIPNGDIAVSYADYPGDGERGTLLLNRLQEGQFDTTISPPTPIFEDVTMIFGVDTLEMDALPSNPTAGPLNHVQNYDDHMAAMYADVKADLWPDLFVVTHTAIYVYSNLGDDVSGAWRGFDRVGLNAILTDPAAPPAPDNRFVLATDTSSGLGEIPAEDKIESGTFGQPMGIDAGDIDNDGDIDFYISDTQVSGDDLFVNQMSDIGVLQFYHCQFNQDEGQHPWGTAISDVD